MLLAVILNHLGAGIWLVADNLAAKGSLQLLDDIFWEAIRIGRERRIGDNTGNFPVANSGILSL